MDLDNDEFLRNVYFFLGWGQDWPVQSSKQGGREGMRRRRAPRREDHDDHDDADGSKINTNSWYISANGRSLNTIHYWPFCLSKRALNLCEFPMPMTMISDHNWDESGRGTGVLITRNSSIIMLIEKSTQTHLDLSDFEFNLVISVIKNRFAFDFTSSCSPMKCFEDYLFLFICLFDVRPLASRCLKRGEGGGVCAAGFGKVLWISQSEE